MTAIVNIPLNKLAQFEGNVRKTQNKGFIDELAASIDAHGLQQNLVVKQEGKKFAVVAGSQRLKALLQLAEAGEIKASHPVPCKLADGELDPSEISLLENVLRENMHPADRVRGVPRPRRQGHPRCRYRRPFRRLRNRGDAAPQTRPRQSRRAQGVPRRSA